MDLAVLRIVACALLAGAPWLARGEPPASGGAGAGPYVALRLGRISGEASGVPGSGFDGEVTVGVRLLPHLGVEAGLGRYALDTSRYYSYATFMAGSTAFRDDHRVTSVTAGLRISGRSRPHWLALEVSALGGVGLYTSRIARIHAFTPYPWEPGAGTTTYQSETTSSGAVGGYLGLSADLVSAWGLSLGFEARYTAVETLPDTGVSGTFDGPGGLRFGAVLAYGL